jgi:hypothetical protein
MLVAQGSEEERVERSHDTVSSITKTLRNASKSMHFYAHNWETFSAGMPRPELTLRAMKVAAFRPAEIAGGIGQLAKASSASSLLSTGSALSAGGTRNNSAVYMTSRAALPHQVVTNPFLAFNHNVSSNGGSGGSHAPSGRGSSSAQCSAEDDDDDVWFESRRPTQPATVKDHTKQPAPTNLPVVANSLPILDDDIFGWGLSDAPTRPPVHTEKPTAVQHNVGVVNRPLQALKATSSGSQNCGFLSSSGTGVGHNTGNATVAYRPPNTSNGATRELIELPDTPIALKPQALRQKTGVYEQPPVRSSLQLQQHVTATSPVSAVHYRPDPAGNDSFVAMLFLPAPLPVPTPVTKRPAFVPLRLRNAVQSTTVAVPFNCLEESSDDDGGATDATLGDGDSVGECGAANDDAVGGRVVTVLDSDLKPRPRPRLGRIMETPSTQMDGDCTDSTPCAGATANGSGSRVNGFNPREEADSGTVCSSQSSTSVSDPGENESCVEAAEWEDTANACCACLDWACEADDPIVFCDGLCGECVHVSCYGLLPHGVPEGDFYCESCAVLQPDTAGTNRAGRTNKTYEVKPSCALCFQAGSLMKRSSCGRWTHPVCVLFTPELTVNEVTHRPDNISALSVERADLVCQLCHRSGGACVQCCVGDCLAAFHPYCAYVVRQQMVVRVDPLTELVTYELYCQKHKHTATTGDTSAIASSRNPVSRKDCKKGKASGPYKQVPLVEAGNKKRLPVRATSCSGARETTARSNARR